MSNSPESPTLADGALATGGAPGGVGAGGFAAGGPGGGLAPGGVGAGGLALGGGGPGAPGGVGAGGFAPGGVGGGGFAPGGVGGGGLAPADAGGPGGGGAADGVAPEKKASRICWGRSSDAIFCRMAPSGRFSRCILAYFSMSNSPESAIIDRLLVNRLIRKGMKFNITII
jgi:hypothetical protein